MLAVMLVGGCAQMSSMTGSSSGKRELIVVGNDEKVAFSAAGTFVYSAPGKDTVSIIDIGTDPLAPRIVVNLPLMNSVFGPPVNMAFSPKGDIALVANSIDLVQDGGALKQVPDDRIYVIDMKANPPNLAATIKARA